MGHGPHSSKLVVICVVLLLFVLFYVLLVFVLSYVLFVCKCVLYYCYRVLIQLQLTNISSSSSSSSDPNIFLSIIFSNPLSLQFSLRVRSQVSHLCKTTGKITEIQNSIYPDRQLSGSARSFG